MAQQNRRLIGGAAAVALVAALTAVAGPATAAQPDTFTFDEAVDIADMAQCDGFVVDGSLDSHVTVRVFFDAAGNVERFQVKTVAHDVLTNRTTQRQVEVDGVFTEIFTRIGDTDAFEHSLVGFRYRGFAEGEGLVLQDVGRIVYDPDHNVVSLAGRHDAEPDELAAVCAALA